MDKRNLLLRVAFGFHLVCTVLALSPSWNVLIGEQEPCRSTSCPLGYHCVEISLQTGERCSRTGKVAHCKPSRRVPKEFPNICHEPKDKGRPECSREVKRYFYDDATGQCRGMVYTGCGGNQNNFHSRRYCEKTCVRRNACCLKKDQGRCRASFPRYYYDASTGSCREFIYGGCGGNDNNFATMSQCMNTCVWAPTWDMQ